MQRVLSILLGVSIACLIGWTVAHPAPVPPMQSISPAYTCQFGNGGVTAVYPCAQYIVEVSPQRLGGGVTVYQVTSSPFDVSGSNISTVTAGTISGTSVQSYVPNSTTSTFTLAVSQP